MTTRRLRTSRSGSALAGMLTSDPNVVWPATREETMPLGLAAVVAGMIALAICAQHQYLLLYGDAVAHLGIARRIIDTNSPGLAQLGGVWLPLPHLLMLPFVGNMQWWQDGMAGAWPSLICFAISVMGMFRLARRMLAPRWALVATAFFGLNANLLYLATTAMTEPLFLALLIWIALQTMEFVDAVKDGVSRGLKPDSEAGLDVRAEARTYLKDNGKSLKDETVPQRLKPEASAMRDGTAEAVPLTQPNIKKTTNKLVLLGMLVLAATMTRYDGWILGAAVWCIVAWHLFKAPEVARRVVPGFVTFTLLAVAGPLLWFWYNHVFGHDWLDFMRGPYSPSEIDRKTSPPGMAHTYWGWHNPAWSLLVYARCAQVDAAAWEFGWLVAAAALWGSWKRWFAGGNKVWLLLWLPLPFYVYSVSYGSVPIFIPQIYPHSFYNSRYGMEMLPVFALFLAVAVSELVKKFGKAQPLVERLAAPVMLMLVAVNLIVMVYRVPLVLKEALVNSRGRLALEQPLAQTLALFGPTATILMDNSDHVGALQAAGIPLKQTIGPSDYYKWQEASNDPAASAAVVVAVQGDPVSQIVQAHPQGLNELSIVCTTNQPCVKIYESTTYKK